MGILPKDDNGSLRFLHIGKASFPLQRKDDTLTINGKVLFLMAGLKENSSKDLLSFARATGSCERFVDNDRTRVVWARGIGVDLESAEFGLFDAIMVTGIIGQRARPAFMALLGAAKGYSDQVLDVLRLTGTAPAPTLSPEGSEKVEECAAA